MEYCLTTNRGKTHEKNGAPKLGPKFGFLPFSQSCIIRLVFLDIAQDCSLGQCLSSSKAEISKKKKKKKKNWVEIPKWSFLF